MAICLICGIPGSGKSYLAQKLSKAIKASKCSIHEFDDYFQPFLDQDLSSGEYKNIRNESFEKIVEQIKEDPNAWHIIVDTFHLQNLRKKFFNIARATQTQYLEIFIDVDLSLALEQNQNRTIKIANSTIEKYFEKFEKPCSTSKFKECDYSIILKKIPEDLKYFLEIYPEFMSLFSIREIVDSPELPQMKIVTPIKQKTLQNTKHQIDIILRREISAFFRLNQMEFAKHITANKKEIVDIIYSELEDINVIENDLENHVSNHLKRILEKYKKIVI
ncbi:MAG: hypothetical protein MHMPM18_000596 [Marteilia pararefringens]